MPRKKIPGAAARTIHLQIETYNAILDYWGRSPSGITGAEVIRSLVHEYGLLCAQALAGEIDAKLLDVKNIPILAQRFFNPDE